MDVSLLAAGDARADADLAAFFEACPTSVAQQTPGWRDVIVGIGDAGMERDEPLFLGCRREGRLVGVLPAYRFAGPLGAILTSVPQAGPLGGVACLPELDPAPVYRALLRAFVELAAARECALATVISSPFWPDRPLYDEPLAPDYALENVCQVLELTGAFDERGRFTGGSENLRRNLRKAESGALVVDGEETAANVACWYAIHAARALDIGATPLPEALFTGALAHMAPRGKARFTFVRRADSGEMVAGGFYVQHQAVIDALMPSVRSDAAALGGAYLLALDSMRRALAEGRRFYNWQGSPPGGGVYRFKRQWGSRDLRYWFLTRVTGDATPFARSTVAEVRAGYPWHYVLPYDRIGSEAGAARGSSSRAAAWEALGAGGGAEAREPADAAGDAPITAAVVAHYERRLAEHGPTARGMDWKDEASQRLRFAVLAAVTDLTGKQVHEVGAGAGHLSDFLAARGIACTYSGSDRSPAMVAAARARLPGVEFVEQDVLALPDAPTWDVVLASGIFHVKLDAADEAWAAFVRAAVQRMWGACREAIAFNLVSDHVDYRVPDLWYADAGAMLDFCRRTLSRRVVLRHDYPLFEQTVYVYRDSAQGNPPR